MRQNLFVIVFASLSVLGCSNQTTASLPTSFSLKCIGIERVDIERGGIVQPQLSGATATIYYGWNDETKALVADHGVTEPTAFCHDEGQEKCSVRVTNYRLSASSFDLTAGKTPNSVNSFGEEIEIDLTTLVGTASATTSAGTLTDQGAHVAFKTKVTIPLRCERSA